MGARARRPSAPASSPRCSPRWPRACASVTVALVPVHAGQDRAAARGARRRRAHRARLRGERLGRARSRALAPLFPKIAHDRLPHPPRRLRAAGRRARRRGAGRRRRARSSRSAPTRRAAARRSPRPSASRRSGRRSAATPTTPRSSTRSFLHELASHPRCVADRRDRAGLLPRPCAARRPAARLRGADRPRPRARQAARDPLPRGRRGHARAARAPRRRPRGRCCTASRCPSISTAAWRPAGGSPSPATSPTRTPRDLAAAAARVPVERLLVETDAPYLAPQSRRGKPNEPAAVVETARVPGDAARRRARRAGGDARAQRRRAVRLVSEVTQPSLRRLAQFERAAAARPRPELPRRLEHPRRDRPRRPSSGADDVVLEIGGGLGVLSEYLRRARRHVHVIEIDRAPRAAAARRARAVSATRRCTSPTRWRSTSRALRPAADEGDREPPLRDRRGRDPAHDRGAAGGRALGGDGAARGGRAARRARPAARSYGVPSVLCQLACEVRVLRAVARSVFVPGPERRLRAGRADARRPGAAAGAAALRRRRVRAPPQGARRLARAQRRRRSASACAPRSWRSGIPPDARAERLAPAELRGAVGGRGREGARAGEDQPLPAGRADARRRPPRAASA